MDWSDISDEVELFLTAALGCVPVRASVAFLGVSELTVLRFGTERDEWVYVTLGLARDPMTSASATIHDPSGPRAELILRVHENPLFADLWRQVAVLAAVPSVEGLVYAENGTVDLGAPLATGSQCCGVVVVSSELGPVPIGPDVVHLFELCPATAGELSWARQHGAGALRQRWAEEGIDLRDLGRDPIGPAG